MGNTRIHGSLAASGTPNDAIIYPLFNIYRAIDDQPLKKSLKAPIWILFIMIISTMI
jgi:hypothetical protein